eukprot:TRINITY_DN604_c0_g1_i5.p1 TRINITY_DN604_c0_g1~~TRINITY_DN604_c0_g1_i5.p1  ORF type:complete len:146 (-),score=32.79 TRINITY_DN604_c0_g1_i5:207-644(-)
MKYLVLVDESKGAHNAFNMALKIMNKEKDELHILNVINEGDAMENYFEVSKNKSQTLLENYSEKCHKNGVKHYNPTSLVGDVRNESINYCQKHAINMIIVGSRGMGMLSRALLGSVSEYIVGHSPVSVLVVKKSEDEPVAMSGNI